MFFFPKKLHKFINNTLPLNEVLIQYDCHRLLSNLQTNVWTTYMDVNFNKIFETSDFQQSNIHSIWARGDMEFLFECSTRYLTSELCSLVRYRVEDKKRNSISPSNHVLFCVLYKHLTKKKKLTLFRFQKENAYYSFMAQKDRASDVSLIIGDLKHT